MRKIVLIAKYDAELGRTVIVDELTDAILFEATELASEFDIDEIAEQITAAAIEVFTADES